MPTTPSDPYDFPVSALVGLSPTAEPQGAVAPTATVDDYPLEALEGLAPTTPLSQRVTAGSETTAPPDEELPMGQYLRKKMVGAATESLTDPHGWVGPRMTLPIIGGIAGGLVGGPPGMAAGSAFGTGLGETYAQKREKELGERKDIDAGEVAWNVALDAGLSVIPGAVPVKLLAYKGVRRALAPLVDAIEKEDQAINAYMKSKDIPMRVSEATGKGRSLENYADRYANLSRSGARYAKDRVKALNQNLDRALQQMDPGYKRLSEDLGKDATKSSKTLLDQAKARVSALFEAPRNFIDLTRKYDTSPVYGEVKGVLDELAHNQMVEGKLAGTVAGAARLPGTPAVMANELTGDAARFIHANNLDKPAVGNMDYDQIRALQTAVGEEIHRIKLANGGQANNDTRLLAKIEEAADLSIDEVSKHYPEVRPMLNKAKQAYQRGVVQRFYESKEYLGMQTQDASTLVRKLFPSDMSIESVRRIKQVLPEKAFKPLKAAMLYNLSGGKPDIVGATFGLGKEFVDNLRKYDREALKEFLGAKDFAEIEKFAKGLERGIRAEGLRGEDLATAGAVRQRGGDWSSILGWGGGGALGATQLGLPPLVGAAMAAPKLYQALAPEVVAWAMNSPKGRKWLIEGNIPKNMLVRKAGKAALLGAGQVPQQLLRDWIADWPLDKVREFTAPIFERGQQLPIPEAPPLDSRKKGPVSISEAFGGGR